MNLKHLLFALTLSTALAAHAAPASDVASNYGGTFTNGSTGGSGLLPWSISSNNNDSSIFAGTFIGDSSAGAGNINTGGASFGLYANPSGAFLNADRAFSSALSVGESFTFKLALNFDNGNKGFNLFAGGQGEVFNFNVGNGGSVSSLNATLTPGSGAGYDYGGNDAVIDVTLAYIVPTALAYTVSRTSSQGNQGTLFSGAVSGLTEAPTGFSFYVSGTDAGGAAQNNLYVNSLNVIPEAQSVALLLGGMGLLLWFRRRRA